MNDGLTPSDGGSAVVRPGMAPRWTSNSKEGVGTAYSTASCVWFTLSHGILNEIYYPTIDRPQIRYMEFLITDGATFFHACLLNRRRRSVSRFSGLRRNVGKAGITRWKFEHEVT